MSELDHTAARAEPSLTLAELTRRLHAEPVVDPADLVADIWGSDEELDAFLADLRESRDSSVG